MSTSSENKGCPFSFCQVLGKIRFCKGRLLSTQNALGSSLCPSFFLSFKYRSKAVIVLGPGLGPGGTATAGKQCPLSLSPESLPPCREAGD